MPNTTQTKPTVQPNPVVTDAEYLNPQPGFGFIPFAELWNGRLAMIGFVAALATEYFTGQGVLHFWGLM